MGLDVTYHPVKLDKINHFFFDVMLNPALAKERAAELNKSLNEDLHEMIEEIYEHAIKRDQGDVFNTGYGYWMGSLAGFLEPYWYLRKASLTGLGERNEDFNKFFSSYEEWIPAQLQCEEMYDGLIGNYSSGVYVEHSRLEGLKSALLDPKYAAEVQDNFDPEQLPILIKAIDHALAHGCALLEMADLIIPNPLNIEQTEFLSYAENLQTEGVELYMEVAERQMAQLDPDGTSPRGPMVRITPEELMKLAENTTGPSREEILELLKQFEQQPKKGSGEK